MNLESMGFSPFFARSFEEYAREGLEAGRVALEHKHLYRLYTEHGEVLAEVSGRMRYLAAGPQDFPAVGDWVAATVRREEGRATIHAVLPRKSAFVRKIAGFTTEEQVVAANVDTVFLMTALNSDFNLRRIERYLVMAWESGSSPVIILNKADLCSQVEERISEVESVAFGVPIHAVSAVTGEGIEELARYMSSGQTIALLGSSGVGKSTLINRLAGEEVQKVQSVRRGDDRGRHTTTHRELIILPEGRLVIDTPGMRELQLWDGEEGIRDTFGDIETLASQCRFADCRHEREPGCAVKQAIEAGKLEPARLESYRKLLKEQAYFERRQSQKSHIMERAKWKAITKAMRNAHTKT